MARSVDVYDHRMEVVVNFPLAPGASEGIFAAVRDNPECNLIVWDIDGAQIADEQWITIFGEPPETAEQFVLRVLDRAAQSVATRRTRPFPYGTLDYVPA